MEQGQGAKLQQVSAKPSDGLILFTVDAASIFYDAHAHSHITSIAIVDFDERFSVCIVIAICLEAVASFFESPGCLWSATVVLPGGTP